MPQELVTNLDEIQRLTDANLNAFEVMGYMIEYFEDIPDEEIDRIVEEVAAPIRAAIDCTQCGNCCRALQVHLSQEDVQQLSDGIHIPVQQIITEYITHEDCAEIGEWGRFKHQPCAFLKGSVCSVYAHRPETCRAYPEMKDFRWLWDTYIDGARICPIIYNTLAGMVERVETL